MDSDWEHWQSGAVKCFVKKFDDARQWVARCEATLSEAFVTIQSTQPIYTQEEAKSKAETAAEMLRGWK